MTMVKPGPGISVSVKGRHQTAAGDDRAQDWWLAGEVPVSLVYNDVPHAVLLASPADLDDLAAGFALGEGVVRQPGAVIMTRILEEEHGFTLCSVIDEDMTGPGFALKRHMEGRTGCGICGLENLSDVTRYMKTRDRAGQNKRPFPAAVIRRAFAGLRDSQPANKLNRSLHAAAIFDRQGTIHVTREDVGRHNALDKVVGAACRMGMDLSDKAVALTSRCSFELVQKAAFAGLAQVATLSAPTDFAVRLAKDFDIGLACLDGDGVMRFSWQNGGT